MKSLILCLTIILSCFNTMANPPPQTREAIVQVSSEVFDIYSQQTKGVSGVGSIVFSQGLVYVLTASHIATGDNLQIHTSTGEPYQIKRQINDFKNDLSLVEVIPHETTSLLGIEKDQELITLMTEDGNFRTLKSRDSSIPVSHIQMVHLWSMRRYKGLFIESPSFDMLNDPGQSVLLLPPGYEGNIESSVASYESAMTKLHRLERSSVSSFSLWDSFPSGFSGSPVLISEVWRLHGYPQIRYVLGGILSTSNSDRATGIGHKAISAILKKASKQTKGELSEDSWFLIDDIFVKWERKNLSVFIDYGPIGNGININGRKNNDRSKLESLEQTPEGQTFLKTIKDLKLPEDSELKRKQLKESLQNLNLKKLNIR